MWEQSQTWGQSTASSTSSGCDWPAGLGRAHPEPVEEAVDWPEVCDCSHIGVVDDREREPGAPGETERRHLARLRHTQREEPEIVREPLGDGGWVEPHEPLLGAGAGHLLQEGCEG